jgi:hypothetical protein
MSVRSIVCLGLLAACGGGGGAGDVSELELGTGQTTFQPIGEEVELVHGPQGGWHVELTLRIWSEAPDGMIVDYVVVRTADEAVVSMSTRYIVDEMRLIREEDHWLRLGDRAILDITMPSEVVGEEVELRVAASASGGAPVDDSRTAVVVDVEP